VQEIRGQSWAEIRESNQSRRACPELVERGRLKITQDAILGYLTSEKDYSQFGQPVLDQVLGNFQLPLPGLNLERVVLTQTVQPSPIAY
jgi:hypothetical protein